MTPLTMWYGTEALEPKAAMGDSGVVCVTFQGTRSLPLGFPKNLATQPQKHVQCHEAPYAILDRAIWQFIIDLPRAT